MKTSVFFSGGVLLAADYSQLELRILAHLSGDTKLAGILNGGGDVFKCIAAQWRQVTEGEVTPKQRQQAKQVGQSPLKNLKSTTNSETFSNYPDIIMDYTTPK